MKNEQMLYLIAHDFLGPVKIGISKDPERRLEQLQTASPVKLHLWAVGYAFEDRTGEDFPVFARLAEEALHRNFAESRLHGEWFNKDVFSLISASESFDDQSLGWTCIDWDQRVDITTEMMDRSIGEILKY